MNKRVYLSRDPGDADNNVELYLHKPEYDEANEWFSQKDNPVESFCYEEFLRITGFKIKPGECKRVRIEIKEV